MRVLSVVGLIFSLLPEASSKFLLHCNRSGITCEKELHEIAQICTLTRITTISISYYYHYYDLTQKTARLRATLLRQFVLLPSMWSKMPTNKCCSFQITRWIFVMISDLQLFQLCASYQGINTFQTNLYVWGFVLFFSEMFIPVKK